MSTRKNAFVFHCIRMIPVDDSTVIPTTLLYRRGVETPLIGRDALEHATCVSDITSGFKIAIGNCPPGTNKHMMVETATGPKAATKLAGDFLRELLKKLSPFLKGMGIQEAVSVMVAEPLALDENPLWLRNYRSNISRNLDREFESTAFKGINFQDHVEFLPEPFAVYQYYRHGLRHPLLSKAEKIRVLVIDMGAGTCDVCVIETTRSGEISEGGANAKPLGAGSCQAGGDLINEHIVRYLYSKCLPKERERLGRADGYRRQVIKGQINIDGLEAAYRAFIGQFRTAVRQVEGPKIALCRQVDSWSLDNPGETPRGQFTVCHPFAADEPDLQVSLSAGEFRELFERRIWQPLVKSRIGDTLDRAAKEPGKRGVDVILLSGGSANIGWLKQLVFRDFAEELSDAECIPLRDYQEVVARGLAVESARRFHSAGQGDFAGTTYNRLCLLLEPSGTPCSPLTFKSLSRLPVQSEPGVLLPSATLLRDFAGTPLKWSVRVPKPPKHFIGYHFLRASLDPEQVTARLNVEENQARVPDGEKTERDLEVLLTVEEDGTVAPSFTYRRGTSRVAEGQVAAKKFYLDATVPAGERLPRAYIGLDFGTSNSSVAFITEDDIHVMARRTSDRAWRELAELVDVLPAPLAVTLAAYVRDVDSPGVDASAREFIEAALAMLGYLSFLECCAQKRRGKSNLFRGFTQRSAGPLWALLKETAGRLSEKKGPSQVIVSMTAGERAAMIDAAVNDVNQNKHGKLKVPRGRWHEPVDALARACERVFSEWRFGYFENVQKQRFGQRFQGRFRYAVGQGVFVRSAAYVGGAAFGDREAVVVSREGRVLELAPLVIWQACRKHAELEAGHCYFLDYVDKSGEASYKAGGSMCAMTLDSASELVGFNGVLAGWRSDDPVIDWGGDVSIADGEDLVE